MQQINLKMRKTSGEVVA